MLDWLKAILGQNYTGEADRRIAEEIEKGYVSKTDFDAAESELNQIRTTLKERDSQLESLKKATGDTEALQRQIAELQESNTKKEQQHAAEIQAIKTGAAVDKALVDSHAKNITAVKALLADFLESAELDTDGTVKGLSDEVKKLAEQEDTAFLFDSGKETAPQFSGATPIGGAEQLDPKTVKFESQLAAARKANDTIAAINIKQEAAAQGVILF